MKKIIVVLVLIIGSWVASDAIAAINFSATNIENCGHPKKECKRKKKKGCCKSEAAAATTKSCNKETKACCKKKTTDAPEPSK